MFGFRDRGRGGDVGGQGGNEVVSVFLSFSFKFWVWD
jgi:hypothetical protein